MFTRLTFLFSLVALIATSTPLSVSAALMTVAQIFDEVI